jgi:hypothetical protein
MAADPLVKFMNRAKTIALSVVVTFVITACGNSDVEESAVEAETRSTKETPEISLKPKPKYDGTIAKPGAPFSVSYKVIGTPIVGSPVTINLRVMSTLGSQPIKVRYRVNDASTMMFHEAQPSEIEMAPAANENFVTQQVTVVPQREGRSYLNVSASFETEEGTMSTVVAIPIQVGKGGRDLQEDGEVQLDENGEAVRVLTPE